MPKEPISFRIDSERRAALGELAHSRNCDLETLINEAIETYLDLHHCQYEYISKRLAAADSGKEGVEHSEVFSRLRQCLQTKLN